MERRVSNIRFEEEYFEMLCELIGLDTGEDEYTLLMKHLYNTDFYWSIHNDDNRVLGGENLRFRLGWRVKNKPCTMLEMLVALAVRCEDEIMYDPDKGNRTEKWFWLMLRNLGLTTCTDCTFEDSWNMSDVTGVTHTLMAREYSRNGVGGLFPLKHPKNDQRRVEIWYQLSAYLLEHSDLE